MDLDFSAIFRTILKNVAAFDAGMDHSPRGIDFGETLALTAMSEILVAVEDSETADSTVLGHIG